MGPGLSKIYDEIVVRLQCIRGHVIKIQFAKQICHRVVWAYDISITGIFIFPNRLQLILGPDSINLILLSTHLLDTINGSNLSNSLQNFKTAGGMSTLLSSDCLGWRVSKRYTICSIVTSSDIPSFCPCSEIKGL